MADPTGEVAERVAAAFGVSPQLASEMIVWQGYVNEEMKTLTPAWGSRFVASQFMTPVAGVMPFIVYLIAPTLADQAAVEAMSTKAGRAHVVATTR